MTSFTGALVRSYFVAGEPIREAKIARGAAGMLAAMLPPGKRAVAIRVSAESTAGGFILPNDRVDVIQNISSSARGKPENTSRTLLRNVRVLAVDQKADETKGQLVVVGKTATLEVSPAKQKSLRRPRLPAPFRSRCAPSRISTKSRSPPGRAASMCAFSVPERARMSKSGARARSFNDGGRRKRSGTGKRK